MDCRNKKKNYNNKFWLIQTKKGMEIDNNKKEVRSVSWSLCVQEKKLDL